MHDVVSRQKYSGDAKWWKSNNVACSSTKMALKSTLNDRVLYRLRPNNYVNVCQRRRGGDVRHDVAYLWMEKCQTLLQPLIFLRAIAAVKVSSPALPSSSRQVRGTLEAVLALMSAEATYSVCRQHEMTASMYETSSMVAWRTETDGWKKVWPHLHSLFFRHNITRKDRVRDF